MDRDDSVGDTVNKVGFLIVIVLLAGCLMHSYSHINLSMHPSVFVCLSFFKDLFQIHACLYT